MEDNSLNSQSEKSLLLKLKEKLISKRLTGSCTLKEQKWSFRSLNEGETLWRDKFISLESNASFLTSERIATLAIGIYAINDIPVENVFEVSRDLSMYERKCAAAERVYDLLSQSDRDFIIELKNAYAEQIEEVADELKKTSPSSTQNLETETKSSESDNLL